MLNLFTKKIFIVIIFFLVIFLLPQPAAAADISPDAIAIRVMPNLKNYSALTWYNKNNFKGSPQNLIVDGYEAVRDGRTVYVNAANLVNGTLWTNIYIISYNQTADSKTTDIFGQILAHWKFNTNPDLTVPGGCSKTANRSCLANSQCPVTEYCTSEKAKIIRDTKRLADLSYMNDLLGQYKKNHSDAHPDYPELKSGSYVAGASTSKWPSWNGELSKLLGAPLPLDPINRMGGCSGFDEDTCWNTQSKSFKYAFNTAKAAGSISATNVYWYKDGVFYVNLEKDNLQCGNGTLETDHGEDCDGTSGLSGWSCLDSSLSCGSNCKRKCSNNSQPYFGRCGDNSRQIPEQCDGNDGVSGNYNCSACKLQCTGNNHIEGGNCLSNTKDCTSAMNSQYPDSTKNAIESYVVGWTPCRALECNDGYYLSDYWNHISGWHYNICSKCAAYLFPDAVTVTSRTICKTTVCSTQACLIESCVSGKHPANDKLSCQADVLICPSTEHLSIDGTKCENNIRENDPACLTGGIKKATQIWNKSLNSAGGGWGSCQATECDIMNKYYLENSACKLCASGSHPNASGTGCEADVVTCASDEVLGSSGCVKCYPNIMENATALAFDPATGQCRATSCVDGYHIMDNYSSGQVIGSNTFKAYYCQKDELPCTIANGTGKQVWSDSAFGECQVVSCDSANGYHLNYNGKSCTNLYEAVCSLEEVKNGDMKSTYLDGIGWGACEMKSRDLANYPYCLENPPQYPGQKVCVNACGSISDIIYFADKLFAGSSSCFVQNAKTQATYSSGSKVESTLSDVLGNIDLSLSSSLLINNNKCSFVYNSDVSEANFSGSSCVAGGNTILPFPAKCVSIDYSNPSFWNFNLMPPSFFIDYNGSNCF